MEKKPPYSVYQCLEDTVTRLVDNRPFITIDETVKRYTDEYTKLTARAKGIYEQSLLMQGACHEKWMVLWNQPSSMTYVVRNNLETVFRAFGLFPSMHEAHHIVKQRVFTRIPDVSILLTIPGFVKATEWIPKAGEMLALMRENVKRIDAVTEAEREFASMLFFDWHYSYSDDRGSYRSGVNAHNAVIDAVQKSLEEPDTDTLTRAKKLEIIQTVASANGLNPSFFTGKDNGFTHHG